MNKQLLTAMSVFSLVSAVLPASALDFDSMVKSYLGTGNVGKGSAAQSIVINNMATRRSQLSQEISAGVATGQITPTEEADLRMNLSNAASLETSCLSDNVLTNAEVQMLLTSLSDVSNKIQTYSTNSSVNAYANISTGSLPSNFNGNFNNGRGGWGRGGRHSREAAESRIREARVDALQTEVGLAIDAAAQNFRVKQSDVLSLRNELNRIASDELSFKSDTLLSAREESILTADLNQLKDRTARVVRSSGRWGGPRNGGGFGGGFGTNIDKRQSQLTQKINNGLLSGRLTRFEADRLLRDASRIDELEARMKLSGGGLSMNERMRLQVELDDLSKKITRELNDHNVW